MTVAKITKTFLMSYQVLFRQGPFQYRKRSSIERISAVTYTYEQIKNPMKIAIDNVE